MNICNCYEITKYTKIEQSRTCNTEKNKNLKHSKTMLNLFGPAYQYFHSQICFIIKSTA